MPPVSSAAPPTHERHQTSLGAVRTVIRLALLVYWLILIVSTHWPGLTQADVPDWGWLPFDKTMHVITFTGLAMLLTWARPLPRRSATANALAAFVIGLLYGALEEFTQPYFDRTGSWADLLADAIGLTVGTVIGWAVLSWAQNRQSQTLLNDTLATSAAQAEISGGGEDSGGGGFVGHAKLVGLMTLVSRMTGLVRDAVLAAVFGATLYLDALLIGFLVPNLFRRLFGEGALTAAFIPRYTKLLKQDPALARRFASLCVVVVAALLAGITLVGEAVLWFALSRATSEKAVLSLGLIITMLPYMPMVCGVAFLGAILQVHKRFGPPAAAPIILNLVMIAAAIMTFRVVNREWSTVSTVALSVLLAGLLQLVWVGIAVLRAAPLTTSFHGTRDTFRDMLRTMLPMIIGLGVFQINTLLDGLIAYGFAAPADHPDATFNLLGRTLDYPMETGAVTTLTLAQRLYQFPLGVFGIAIATAIFPALAAAATKRGETTNGISGGGGDSGGGGEFADILRRGLRLTFFIGLPASVGLILVRVPMTRVFFEWNEFTADDAARSAVVLAGYASAVWAYSMTHVLTKAFYAADDAMTPLKVSAAMVSLNIALNLALIWPLGVAGLAWSTAISASLQTLLLLRLIRRHVDRPIDDSVWRGWRTTAGLTVVMGLAVGASLWAFDPMALGKTASVGVLALGVGVGGVIYLAAARLSGAAELGWLLKRG